MDPKTISVLAALAYMLSAALFISGLKMLSKSETAVRGNLVSFAGMTIAITATLLLPEVADYKYILIGGAIGGIIGAAAAVRVPMTSMPEFVALFNGTGGLASLLVGWAEFYKGFLFQGTTSDLNLVNLIAIYLAVLIGGVTFTGSLIAYGKLSARISSKPYLFKGQQIFNILVLLVVVACGVIFCINTTAEVMPPWTPLVFYVAIGVSLLLGIMVTIPIGGADMPVVISLLNSYSGLAACAAGFVIENTVLIVAGTLVGASGIVLTVIMCKAMNRSLANVLFSGFGASEGAISTGGGGEQGEAKALTAEDAYYVLEAASSVVFVPGYGMAVAQAQHVVKELGDILEENGCDVRYCVHPVAGRMPGHMNVLLAEADVPYEQLVELDDVNPTIETVDVAIVIGANDVVNPAARDDPNSDLAGMPIINVDRARSCFVLKRSLRSGFAGVENPLFFKPNTRMLFGDAKTSITAIVAEFKNA